MLKCIIIDDEKISREVVKNYVDKYCEGVQVCGEGANIEEALKLVAIHQPDLVFLDVEMPLGTGFDLLEKFDNPCFDTIFITAFSEYALQAMNTSASYYLLKPIKIDDLVAAVDKVKETRKKGIELDRAGILSQNLKLANSQEQRVVLPTMEGFEVIKVAQIVHCQADDNFTVFYLDDGSKKMICRSLKHFENVLNELNFLRVHKSHLINLKCVVKFAKGKVGTITLNNGQEIPLAQSKKQEFLEVFK